MKKFIFVLVCIAILAVGAVGVSAATYGDWQYEVVGEEITIIGCDKSMTVAEIPAVIDGKPVTRIHNLTFYYTENLTKVIIPESTTYIEEKVFNFDALETLASIEVSENNMNYSSVDGVLYNKDKTEIVSYPPGKNGTAFVIPDGVVRIADSAFGFCRQLKELTIPKSVTTIGGGAFIVCESLESMEIPEGVTSIGNNAFMTCTSLIEITLPSSVTEIYGSQFINCFLLKNIEVSANNENYCSVDGVVYSKDKTKLIKYPAGKAQTSYAVADGVASIESSAFEDANQLKTITFPDTLMKIGHSAFLECVSLETIEIPDGVTSINGQAFRDCAALKSAVMPVGVMEINMYDFQGCTALESITLSFNIASISDDAFVDCSNLKNVYFKGTESEWDAISIGTGNDNLLNAEIQYSPYVQTGEVETSSNMDKIIYTLDNNGLLAIIGIGYMGFDSAPWYDSRALIKSVKIYNGVEDIGFAAFSACYNMTDITIPESVTGISDEAFRYCEALTDITIPSKVRIIGDYAFQNCKALENINIPDSVAKIGAIAFGGCKKLEVVLPDNIKEIGSGAFDYTLNYYDESNWEDGVFYIGKYLLDSQNVTGGCAVKEGTVLIADGAFYNSELSSITIPEGVTLVGEKAFYRCVNLTDITLPGSIKTIAYNAFWYCKNLSDALYYGTADDWGAVRVNSGNTYLADAVRFSEVTVTDEIGEVTMQADKDTYDTYGFIVKFNTDSINIPENAYLFVALYAGNVLKEVAKCQMLATDVCADVAFTTDSHITTAKVMLWESLSNLVPLCKYCEITIR